MSLESLDEVRLQCDFEGVDRINKHDLAIIAIVSPLQTRL